MPIERKDQRPYMQFNFQLQIDGQDVGGFQEVTGLGTEVAITEYRHGNEKSNNVRKLTGLNKAADVTLKRGILGTDVLFSWMDGIRKGNPSDLRTVKVELLSEDHTTVMTWNLLRARPMKLTYGPLSAKANDVAMEEMVLAYETMEME
jgi:phage tail-like protein